MKKANPKMEKVLKLFYAIFLLLLFSLLISGCFARKKWKLVELTDEKPPPLMRYVRKDANISTEILSYVKDNFFIRLTNVKRGYELIDTPTVKSQSGEVGNFYFTDNKMLEFNLVLEDKRYLENDVDVEIKWRLGETGEEGFLISERLITIDISKTKGNKYVVKSVKYQPVTDKPN